jgi:threonyl-tRNA synthetase
MQKMPYLLVVGDKEMASGAVAVRARGGQDLGSMSLDDFMQKITEDISKKSSNRV